MTPVIDANASDRTSNRSIFGKSLLVVAGVLIAAVLSAARKEFTSIPIRAAIAGLGAVVLGLTSLRGQWRVPRPIQRASWLRWLCMYPFIAIGFVVWGASADEPANFNARFAIAIIGGIVIVAALMFAGFPPTRANAQTQ